MVCLDEQRCSLLNFDKQMRLKKELPLKNIVQVEQSNADDATISILFVDIHRACRTTLPPPRARLTARCLRGACAEVRETHTLSESGLAVRNKPETLYTLRFMSRFHKNEFIKTLLDQYNRSKRREAASAQKRTSTVSEHDRLAERRRQTTATLAGLRRQVEDVVRQINALQT